jgi:hypothetical protein
MGWMDRSLLVPFLVLFFFWGSSILFPIMAVVTFAHKQYIRIPLPLKPCQHWCFDHTYSNLIVVLICIFLKFNNAEIFHAFVEHLHAFFWEMFIQIISFARLLVKQFGVFAVTCSHCSHILTIVPLLDEYFLPLCRLSLHSVLPFAVQKLVSVLEPHLSIFALVACYTF